MNNLLKELNRALKETARDTFKDYRQDMEDMEIKSVKDLIDNSYSLEPSDSWDNVMWDTGYISGIKCAINIVKRQIQNDNIVNQQGKSFYAGI